MCLQAANAGPLAARAWTVYRRDPGSARRSALGNSCPLKFCTQMFISPLSLSPRPPPPTSSSVLRCHSPQVILLLRLPNAPPTASRTSFREVPLKPATTYSHPACRKSAWPEIKKKKKRELWPRNVTETSVSPALLLLLLLQLLCIQRSCSIWDARHQGRWRMTHLFHLPL